MKRTGRRPCATETVSDRVARLWWVRGATWFDWLTGGGRENTCIEYIQHTCSSIRVL
jgi:hypothetical protein